MLLAVQVIHKYQRRLGMFFYCYLF